MNIHPDFITEIKKLLPADEIDNFLVACDKPVKKSISVCIGKIDPDKLVEITTKRWWHLLPSQFHTSPWSYYIDRDDTSTALGRTFLYQAWFFYIQELAASLPASQIEAQPWALVLDMAAAPWWKTTQIAHALLAQWGRPGLVIANDIAPLRVKTMAHNLNMMWCYNTALTKRNGGMFWKHLPEAFDHALLDAPCSGEWTRFKSDSALSFRRKEEINKITGTQFQLLISAVKAVKAWGSIIYSTCTLNQYENEEILNRILEFFPDTLAIEPVHFTNLSAWITTAEVSCAFDPNAVARCRPHRQGTGGFFVSKIRKIASTHTAKNARQDSKLAPKNPFSLDMSKSLFKKVGQFLDETFGIKLNENQHLLAASKEQIYLCSPDLLKLQWMLHFEKVWIPILKIDGVQYRPTHYLGNILGHLATKNVITLDDTMMQQYSQNEEFIDPSLPERIKWMTPYYIVKRKDYGMSVSKRVPEGRKNKWGK
jgi:16S rRNA (cytosine1407-C5)-methyltransferase